MKNLIIILLLALPGLMFGQAMTGEIQGKVFDESGTPLPGINVYVEDGGRTVGAPTDIEGHYTIKPLKPGTYNVHFSGISFARRTINRVQVTPDNITYLPDVTMKLDAQQIGPAIVTEFVRPLIPKDAGKVEMLAAEFEHSPAAKNPTKLIASMTSDIKEGSDGELYFRGSRAGAVQYIVDGVKLRGQLNRFPSSAIGSISVYTGGVPAKYGDVTGGVIVVETKNYMDFYNKEMARRRNSQ